MVDWEIAIQKKPSRGSALEWLKEHVSFAGDECLSWPFSRKGNGYGQINLRQHTTHAHRLMCMLAHGQPPTPGHEAAHNCGKGHLGCVNPRHLRWATKRENLYDRVEHGTLSRGEEHPWAKITNDEATAIIVLRGRLPQAEIARLFNVTTATVSAIQIGKTWKVLAEPPSVPGEKIENPA